MSKHPAACPYCGGTTVNQAQPDMLLRPAQLNDDGSIIIGDVIDGSDFIGPSLLYCHGCGSEYVQPAGVPETHNSALKIDYPPTLVAAGHRVRWLTEAVFAPVCDADDPDGLLRCTLLPHGPDRDHEAQVDHFNDETGETVPFAMATQAGYEPLATWTSEGVATS